ncbi:hypothetical protein [Apibacter sp. HY039]|uniref:hypothetical protein n=1 Tax=Apibacter sp. HY039 TaxID=2501476 RepID=UPI000FEC0A06|nr:hypothetical protein [Apibacter sp. HY039]
MEEVPRIFYSLEFVDNGRVYLKQTFFTMTTRNKKVEQNLNPKDCLTTLENFKSILDYENLDFTIKFLCEFTQTAQLAKTLSN